MNKLRLPLDKPTPQCMAFQDVTYQERAGITHWPLSPVVCTKSAGLSWRRAFIPFTVCGHRILLISIRLWYGWHVGRAFLAPCDVGNSFARRWRFIPHPCCHPLIFACKKIHLVLGSLCRAEGLCMISHFYSGILSYTATRYCKDHISFIRMTHHFQ